MSVAPLENSPFSDIDRPKSPETMPAVDIFAKYGNASPEVKKTVWEKSQKLRSRYPNLSDDAYLALLGGERFRQTFLPPEAVGKPLFPEQTQPLSPSENTPPTGFERVPESLSPKTGSQFMDEMRQLGSMNNARNREKMDQAILAEIDAGHIPTFVRRENFQPVTMTGPDGTRVTFRTSADYLAIGTDQNFVRVPITPLLALRLKEKYGWEMPTATMTDRIYDSAGKKLRAVGMVNNNQDELQMQEVNFIQRNNSAIETQLTPDEQAQVARGELLVAGTKKDIIVSRYAIDHPDVMDFRGFYQVKGTPTQRNPAHTPDYRDYAQGFRLVDGRPEGVEVVQPDGTSKKMSYEEALRDPNIARVLNGAEGAIDSRQAYHGKIYQRAYGPRGYLA